MVSAVDTAASHLFHPEITNSGAAAGVAGLGAPGTTPMPQCITKSQWKLLNIRHNIKELLHIGGVEKNPGPEPKHDKLVASHININSITAPGKLEELELFVETNGIGLLALTETKLDTNTHPTLYNISGFHAPMTRHRDRKGGGVALYCHSTLPITRLTEFENNEEEWIWAKVKTNNITLIFCCLYLPPNLSASRLDSFLDNFSEAVSIAHAHNPTSIIILGDFNAGNIYLQNQHNHSGITSFDNKLKNLAEALELEQLICEPTRPSTDVENLRDLCFVYNTAVINDTGVMSPFSTLDHFPVVASLKTKLPAIPKTYKIIWEYDKMDADLLTELLMNTDWNDIIEKDIDTAVEEFTSAILDAAHRTIPTKTVTVRQRDKPWVTADLKRVIRKRDRLFKRAKTNQTEYDWRRWREQRNLTTTMTKQLKQQYIQTQVSTLLENKQNPHKYHQTLRDITGRGQDKTIPPLETTDGQILTDDKDKASLLNDFFAEQSNIHVPDSHSNQLTSQTVPFPSLNSIRVTREEVLRALNTLDPNKSTGPDELPAKILKLTAILIAEPLAKLFNKSLREGIFPASWKLANIKPIFKNKGSPSAISNYRPISLLSCLSKVLERLVFKQIYEHLLNNDLLTEKQSGYRPNHSTQLQLMFFSHNLYKAIDTGHDFTAVYLDISRYFDKIWHKGLLHKCKYEFGITGNLLNWLTSYLSDREQRVKIGDSYSTILKINAGCPQGSVLGPLLAILYLNDLSNKTLNETLFFADDTSIFVPHTPNNLTVVENSLQNDLDEIYRYGQKWIITFNASKTVQQTFSNKQKSEQTVPCLTFGGEPIPKHSTHKHLGLVVSEDLKFKEHVNDIIKKVNKNLGPLYPIAPYLPRNILEQIYTVYIRPYFDNSDIIYDGLITTGDAIRLERLQNRAARIITGTLIRTSSDKLKTELGWSTLSDRRQQHKLNLYYTIINNPEIPSYIKEAIPPQRINQTNRPLRNATTRTEPINRTTKYHNSYIPATTRLWNQLTEETRTKNTKLSFKKEISKILAKEHPPKYYSLGSKTGNCLLTRLRVGMSKLNAHSFTIQGTESPNCHCGSQFENVRHYFLYCPLYIQQRLSLFRSITHIICENFALKSDTEKLNIILHGTSDEYEKISALAQTVQSYILTTKRF